MVITTKEPEGRRNWNSFWWDSALYSTTTANLTFPLKIKTMNFDLEKISRCLKRIRSKNSLKHHCYSPIHSALINNLPMWVYISCLIAQLLS